MANTDFHVTADPFAAGPTHDMDYFVPNFGLDHDMLHTAAHEAAASKALGHVWTPTKDEDDKWILPKEDAFFKL